MDMQKVIYGLQEVIEAERHMLPEPGDMTDKAHLLWMLEQVENGSKTGDKAHRWIGYVQGVIVAHGLTSVEEMRDLNR